MKFPCQVNVNQIAIRFAMKCIFRALCVPEIVLSLDLYESKTSSTSVRVASLSLVNGSFPSGSFTRHDEP